MKRIPLMRRSHADRVDRVVGHALVDDEDFARLSAYRWGMYEGAKTNYALRGEHIAGTRGTRTYYMHREVLGLPQGSGHDIEADHWDFDGLNNVRSNLRIVTRSEQMKHRRPYHRKNKQEVA